MNLRKVKIISLALIMISAMLFFNEQVFAAASSLNVVIIGGTALDTNLPCDSGASAANDMGSSFGGCLPVNPAANSGLAAFNFTPMLPSAVTTASLAPFDSAVLNVASSAMGCSTGTLSTTAKTALVDFVNAGNKLVIYDSECVPGPDYSWLPFPFVTNNPGATGSFGGTLTVVENNTLSSNNPSDPHFIDTTTLTSTTDAVGDMNVMTTLDPHWCIDMSGTNVNQVTGPVHTYAKFPEGTDMGLFIYNGLDQNFQTSSTAGTPILQKIWLFELQQPFNPSNLPCGFTVVGITLTPPSATNDVGQMHTVTATLTNLLGAPEPGIAVTFNVIAGPNMGVTGTCSANANCTTDANGQVSFTYTDSGGAGIDQIQATFTNQAGKLISSQIVTKEWVVPPFTSGRMTGGGSVFGPDGVRVTHGFQLNCNPGQGPNDLEINWKGSRFHLTQLDSATCFDNPAISPNPPPAGFDTYEGEGVGRYNGVPGATATWTFTDQGEPGKKDTAQITIEDNGGHVVLDVPVTNLKNGNHQAHSQ